MELEKLGFNVYQLKVVNDVQTELKKIGIELSPQIVQVKGNYKVIFGILSNDNIIPVLHLFQEDVYIYGYDRCMHLPISKNSVILNYYFESSRVMGVTKAVEIYYSLQNKVSLLDKNDKNIHIIQSDMYLFKPKGALAPIDWFIMYNTLGRGDFLCLLEKGYTIYAKSKDTVYQIQYTSGHPLVWEESEDVFTQFLEYSRNKQYQVDFWNRYNSFKENILKAIDIVEKLNTDKIVKGELISLDENRLYFDSFDIFSNEKIDVRLYKEGLHTVVAEVSKHKKVYQ